MKEVDALQFPDGAVLVTDRALARWAALLPRASAVVSEKGGMTGHLANVAREFRVPALFGAAGVIDRLAGQERITVDADACRIYPGQIQSLLDLSGRLPSKTPDGRDAGFRTPRKSLRIDHPADPAGSGQSGVQGAQLPDASRHHPVLPRKKRS